MTNNTIGRRLHPHSSTINADGVIKFQEKYENLWMQVYLVNATKTQEEANEAANKACRNFFLNFGKPNKLYYTHNEFDEVNRSNS